MSTVSLRRKFIRPEEIGVALSGPDEVTLHILGFSWQGSVAEFYMLIGSLLSGLRAAEDQQDVLSQMLPISGAK